MPTNPDNPQRSPNVEAEVAAVDAASTKPPAALLREMSGVPAAVFTVIDTSTAPALSAERLAQIHALAQAAGDRLQAQHEEMEARPALVDFPMTFPFSLQKNTLPGYPAITFSNGERLNGKGVLTYRKSDSEVELELIFNEGETRNPFRIGDLEYSITYRDGVFYYTGPDFRIKKMIR